LFTAMSSSHRNMFSLETPSNSALPQCAVAIPRSVEESKDDVIVHVPRNRLRDGYGNTRSVKVRPVHTKIWSNLAQSNGTAATPFSLAIDINLSSTTFPEIADWAAIYDLMRIKKITVHHFPFIGTAATVAPYFTNYTGALTFDPNQAAPTTTGQALQNQFHDGPLFVTAGVNGNSCQSSMFHIPYRKFVAAAPPLAPISSTDAPGSAWIDLDFTTIPTICSYLGFAPATGSTGVLSVLYYIELDVEFKQRV